MVGARPEKEIADVLWMYGDERQSRRIARAIVQFRRGDTPLLHGATWPS